jgi:hypothetical protein
MYGDRMPTLADAGHKGAFHGVLTRQMLGAQEQRIAEAASGPTTQ